MQIEAGTRITSYLWGPYVTYGTLTFICLYFWKIKDNQIKNLTPKVASIKAFYSSSILDPISISFTSQNTKEKIRAKNSVLVNHARLLTYINTSLL